MLSSIYLTGGSTEPYPNPYADISAPYADWRTVALSKLQRYGLKVVNPLEFVWEDFPFSEANAEIIELEKNIDERVQRSLELIDQCDGLLANLNRPNYGTAMEIFYAFRHHKMVTVIGQPPFSPWVLSHSQARFSDIDHALEHIIVKQSQSEPLLWALQYEALLSERYEELPKAGEPDYRFIGGETPVLVVAPHATAYFKEGEFQEAETFTGSMAALLNRLAGCHVLTSNNCCVADPLSYSETPFCRALSDIVKTGQIGFILFLLGSAWKENPGLQIQHKDGIAENDFARRLKLELLQFDELSIAKFGDQNQVLPSFINEELSTPALVLRTHKRYRMPRLQPAYFTVLVTALSRYLKEIGKQLLRSQN